jgi:hypothetical protein
MTTDNGLSAEENERRDRVAVAILQSFYGGGAAATIDDVRNHQHCSTMLRVASGLIAMSTEGRYLAAHEGGTANLFGRPLYQHTCGAVRPMSLQERAEVGGKCEACESDSPNRDDWRLLFREAGR